jgi:thiamine-monophosphate kinase
MRTLGTVGEFGFIERIARILPGSAAVIEGVGDDCAVLRTGDRLLLVSTDLAVEDVHFRSRYCGPEDIGRQAAASGLSDIAAMGGTPLFSLVSLACPVDTELAFIENLYQGMTNLLSRFGAVVVGGDTSRSADGVVIDVVMIGEARGGRYVRRRGAQPGDRVCVTGNLGLSAAGLHAFEHGNNAPALKAAHCNPHPRIPEGQWLCDHDFTHAMIDVSDGLAQDVGHLAEASQLGVDLHAGALPIAPELAAYCERESLDPIHLCLAGGEDYELAFAISEADCEEALHVFHHEFRTKLAVVGEFTDDWPGVRIDGQERAAKGHDHFREQAPVE